MKVRSGFVSNSSSSSFILKLDKDIDNYSLDEFREMLGSKAFDPVAQLYYDLKNKEYSKEDYSYAGEYIPLGQHEYQVSYADDSSEGNFMEHDFMPMLEDSLVIHSRSHH